MGWGVDWQFPPGLSSSKGQQAGWRRETGRGGDGRGQVSRAGSHLTCEAKACTGLHLARLPSKWDEDTRVTGSFRDNMQDPVHNENTRSLVKNVGGGESSFEFLKSKANFFPLWSLPFMGVWFAVSYHASLGTGYSQGKCSAPWGPEKPSPRLGVWWGVVFSSDQVFPPASRWNSVP